MHQYVHLRWAHDFVDEDNEYPVEYYSEIGEDRYETRQVAVFADGSVEYADENDEVRKMNLAEIPHPALEEINSQSGLSARYISAAEFELAFERALSYTRQKS